MKATITIVIDVKDAQDIKNMFDDMLADLGVQRGKDSGALDNMTYLSSNLKLEV